MDNWIDVNERLPAETHSLFWPWRDSPKWSNAMWKEQSDKVLVTIRFKDGTKIVRTGETHDGKWHTDVSRTLEPVVTHWMPIQEVAAILGHDKLDTTMKYVVLDKTEIKHSYTKYA